MKKTKLSLSLIACLLSVGALAGCEKRIKSSDDGVLLTYYVDGDKSKPYYVLADDILDKCYDDSSKYQAIYDTIYSIIVKNYFATDREHVTFEGVDLTLGKAQMEKIRSEAKEKVQEDIDQAHENADANKNNTKYKKELEAILSSKGVETIEELEEHYVEEIQKTTFEKNFYTYQMETIKGGDQNVKLDNKVFWNGYFEDQMPYHVSHILVELADTSDTNYHNGTISEDNAERMFNVVNAIAKGEDSFSKIASDYSQDSGSRVNSGDLGIMDYGTGFIDEFKLGIYAYEKFYRDNEEAISNPNFATEAAINTKFVKSVKGSFKGEVPEVEFSVLGTLKSVASIEKDTEKEPVMENSTLVYPRNIMYNKYLNKHSVFFITDENATPLDVNETKKTSGWVAQNINTYDDQGAFVATKSRNVLSVKVNGEWQPVLCVRASSQGKQEMHLMVINRSPFHAPDGAVSLSDYYTTYYPKQPGYPKDGNGDPIKSYVNFVNDEINPNKTRATELASKFKEYDSDRLGKYIFLRYKDMEKITFSTESGKLESALMKWITTSVEKKATERQDNWKTTWNNYIDKLERQNSERNKLVPEACRIAFNYANELDKKVSEVLDTDETNEIKQLLVEDGVCADESAATTKITETLKQWFSEKGGLCNDGKEYK